LNPCGIKAARLSGASPVLDIVNATVGETEILHLMNGFVLPPTEAAPVPAIFQQTFHRDFPRYLNGYLASVDAFIAIDAFTPENGATLAVPRTHRRANAPGQAYIQSSAVPILACARATAIALSRSLRR
jgi:ectoine hydroxylase-related dioxygenase (phytanoyl-CoA dioxygenase family)